MQLGMVGLGRMGASLVRRLTKDGHECVVYDVNVGAVKKIAGRGVRGADSIDELITKLAKPRAVWVMVPAAVAGRTVEDLASHMDAGDIIIDGGNCYYRDDVSRAAALEDAKGIHYVDCGTSGGVFGLERGYCLMIGGEDQVVQHLDPIFKSIAPGVKAAPRTPGKKGAPGHRRAGLSALRPDRRRPLRQDGPQRHRVRPDGGLCRGAEHPAQRQCRQAGARYGCRDDAVAGPRVLPVRTGPARDRGSLAPRQRDRLVVAGPYRRSAGE